MIKTLTILILASVLTGCLSPIGTDPEGRECPRYLNQTKAMCNDSNLGIYNEI